MPPVFKLSDIHATHVSYVSRGANRKKFFLLKSQHHDSSTPDFVRFFDIFAKSDSDKKLVYGVVYEPDVLDSQNEFADADAIEEAAHRFLEDSRNIDLKHNFIPGVASVVESYIAPADFSLNHHLIKKGSWILVTKASDHLWPDILSGHISAYSMAGSATKSPAPPPPPAPCPPRSPLSLFKSLLSPDSSILHFPKGDLSMDDNHILDLINRAIENAIAPLDARISAIENSLLPSSDSASPDPLLKSALDPFIAPLAARLSAIENARGFSRQFPDPVAKAFPSNSSVFAGLNL